MAVEMILGRLPRYHRSSFLIHLMRRPDHLKAMYVGCLLGSSMPEYLETVNSRNVTVVQQLNVSILYATETAI